MARTTVDNVNHQAATPEDVLDAVHKVMHLFRAEQYRVLRGSVEELTHFEGKALGFFSRRPGATLSDLVSHTGRDKGQLARLIKGLKEQKLLEAQSDDDGDRRSVRLRLTKEGAAVHQVLQRQLGRVARLAVKGMSDAEQQQLFALLQKLRANLETE